MSEVVLSEDDLEHLIKGACFLGSGGGGPLYLAEEIKKEILKGPKPIELVNLEDVGEDDMLCMVAGVGAPSAQASFSDSPLKSFAALEKEKQKQFKFVIPLETGAVNSLIPLLVVARSKEKVSLVNADGGGRSFPQIKMSAFALNKIDCDPAAIGVEGGVQPQIFHIKNKDYQALEDAIRQMSGPSTLATFFMTGGELKTTGCCVPKALRKAIEVGEALELPTHKERIAQIGNLLEGREVKPLIVNGKFTKLCQIKNPCFDVGTVTLSEEGSSGPDIQICFVNESIAVRVDQKPFAMAPLMLCYLTTEGKPFTNAELMKDWKTWQDVPVTLTQIAPPKGIDVPDEKRFFLDIYQKYFPERL